jgi:hypothetical protein
LLIAFRVGRVQGDAVYRAHLLALRYFEMSHALGTTVRVNFINKFTLEDGVVWALWLTDIAVDAFISNNQGHRAGVLIEVFG